MALLQDNMPKVEIQFWMAKSEQIPKKFCHRPAVGSSIPSFGGKHLLIADAPD